MEVGVFSLSDIYPGRTDTAASRMDDINSYGILASSAASMFTASANTTLGHSVRSRRKR